MTTASDVSPEGPDQKPARVRILDAAFAAFGAYGYAQTSMLEIATRAKVSKRELYALIGNKHEMLVACISERTGRMRPTGEVPEPFDRAGLADVLSAFGERLLCEVSDPVVLGVFRLAIAEAERAPEIARALDSIGRAAARKELATILERAQSRGLLGGDTAEMTERFLALLWGDLLMKLLLRLAEPPSREEARHRANAAVMDFLRLEPAVR